MVVLIDCEHKTASKLVSKSGWQFCDRYVITVGSLISDFLPIDNSELRLFVTKKSTANGGFFRCEAKIARIFESDNINQCVDEVFGEWTINSVENANLARKSLSLFLILDLSPNNFHAVTDDVLVELGALRQKIRGSEDEIFHKGREILIESVPFGNKNFLSNQSCGIVSNLLGKNNCFILSDCPTVPGSEGSPVYLRETYNFAVGLVLSSLSWWRGEWIGLTICINLFVLLDEILSLETAKNLRISSLPDAEPFLLQITCMGQWGTAILLCKTRGLLLTNSHVVRKGERVVLRWRDDVFHGEVLYQTSINSPCDLAFLRTDPKNCKSMESVRFAKIDETVEAGETVFAAGYSLFPHHLKTAPTLSRGIISQISSTMLKTTCCINPGASGGALIRANGELLGIIVSNAKLMEREKITFPRVNMCIPIAVVRGVIERFLENEDVRVLGELEWLDGELWRDWVVFEAKL